MNAHWHTSIENILWTGLAAILVINLARVGASRLVQAGGLPGDVGKAIGALVR